MLNLKNLPSRMLGGLFLLALLLPCQARAGVTDDPIVPAVVVQGLDYLQTLEIADSCRSDGRFHETNPILGRCPSKAEVGRYFAVSALGLLAVHSVLPERYKPILSYVWLAVEVGATSHNAAIGVRVGF